MHNYKAGSSDNGWHRLSTVKMTCAVYVEDEVVTRTPPILRRFVGQPLNNLVRWMSMQPGFETQQLDEEPEDFRW